jgi:hypothetical protein
MTSEHFMTLFFDRIARAITSLGAVIFVLLMVIAGMIFFSHTLFLEVFPDTMSAWEKIIATWVIALGWELTVLITTCNKEHVPAGIPYIMAIASGLIVLFFIQAFDADQDALVLSMRWFVGILVATINWIYAELFYKKWRERNQLVELPSRVIQLESDLVRAQRDLADRESKINEAESALKQSQSKFDEASRKLNDLQEKLNEYQRELTCPHCGTVQANPRTLNAHKGHCEKNPNRKQLNGHSASDLDEAEKANPHRI